MIIIAAIIKIHYFSKYIYFLKVNIFYKYNIYIYFKKQDILYMYTSDRYYIDYTYFTLIKYVLKKHTNSG